MNKTDKKIVNYTNYILIITSIIYAVFKYFLEVSGEWGREPHFLTKYLQSLHILISPLLIFSIGLIFKSHILIKINSNFRPLRKTGIALLIIFVVMSLSGYLVQVSSIKIREISVLIHLLVSAFWVILFTYHSCVGKKINNV